MNAQTFDPAISDLDTYCPAELRESVTQLAPLLYQDLKKLAHSQRVKLFSPHTLTTTALINEAFLRLHEQPQFRSQRDFLRVAAVTMRHLLIDRIRQNQASKRGGDQERIPLDEVDELVVENPDTVIAVHDALARMAEFAPRLAQIVECRYFAGFTDAEIAEALGITERTVRRDWTTAKAWLASELDPDLLDRGALPAAGPG